MLVVGPPVNVDDVACAMFHGLRRQGRVPAAQREGGAGGAGEVEMGRGIGVAMGRVGGVGGGGGAQARWEGSSVDGVQQEQAAVHVKANGRSRHGVVFAQQLSRRKQLRWALGRREDAKMQRRKDAMNQTRGRECAR